MVRDITQAFFSSARSSPRRSRALHLGEVHSTAEGPKPADILQYHRAPLPSSTPQEAQLGKKGKGKKKEEKKRSLCVSPYVSDIFGAVLTASGVGGLFTPRPDLPAEGDASDLLANPSAFPAVRLGQVLTPGNQSVALPLALDGLFYLPGAEPAVTLA